MGIIDILKKQDPRSGIKLAHDSKHKFVIKREKDDMGFEIYVLENTSMGERIVIPRFLFDIFRSTLRTFHSNNQKIELKVIFKSRNFFNIFYTEEEKPQIIIQELELNKASKGYLKIDKRALTTLDQLLFHKDLGHPNDLLKKIISYHKLFHFTFDEGGESINSSLNLKKNVLSEVVNYYPSANLGTAALYKKTAQKKDYNQQSLGTGDQKASQVFKERLGERLQSKAYKIDYENLFAAKANLQNQHSSSQSASKQKGHNFVLPIMASDIKKYVNTPFKCELEQEEAQDLRTTFLKQRDQDYFIGFEVLDAVHEKNGQLKSFKMPLYYMKVNIRESGRTYYLDPEENGRIYLNHLALAQLVDRFASVGNDQTVMDQFFSTLLAQQIEVNGQFTRIYISRTLPFSSEIFEKTRDILIGEPGENGKGGLFSSFNLLGIECDLESVYLYKSSKTKSIISSSLEEDLNGIREIAETKPEQFYRSLLGGFLSPDTKSTQKQQYQDPVKLIPGYLSNSTKTLLQKLSHHNIVLLEGPPGTGKTYTIMNLFLHYLCEGKRVLIVSDKEGAVVALVEKLVDYFTDGIKSPQIRANMLQLWNSAIKVVEQAPAVNEDISKWSKTLEERLAIESIEDFDEEALDPNNLKQQIAEIDKKMSTIVDTINALMHTTNKNKNAQYVTPKHFHETTKKDIENLITFLGLLGKGQHKNGRLQKKSRPYQKLVANFIKNRELVLELCNQDLEIYELLSLDDPDQQIDRLSNLQSCMADLYNNPPRRYIDFKRQVSNYGKSPLLTLLDREWRKVFPPKRNKYLAAVWTFLTWFHHPLRNDVKTILKIILDQLSLFNKLAKTSDGFREQLKTIHGAIPKSSEGMSLSLEICRFTLEHYNQTNNLDIMNHSIHHKLHTYNKLHTKRDDTVYKLSVLCLKKIALNAKKADSGLGATNAVTSISSMLQNIGKIDDPASVSSTLNDLKQVLYNTYPIWICRKQVVPFLLPCVEQSFDLVIVDEATQCRVDDALPLLFRANKFMVVGDDKQTVLDKDSPIDDYLFNEFNLDEHLRSTQARGIKGGGSHIFGLVKGIKEASVMLDEHYRCPADIIEFSNKYVYGSELKTMQWTPENKGSSIVINYDESKLKQRPSRQENGMFKGLETEMIDRFLEYILRTIPQIEKETGKKINVETDVAICYFLLKNEPYFKRVKGDFLRKLDRGSDILDGAGAALQGKERDYIFYFWDINKGNMMAFSQGDDPDKRKGELNVLMSRPKKRAYHYLHYDFQKLNHQKSSIAEYLWKSYESQSRKKVKTIFIERSQQPGEGFLPWKRSSGQLMGEMLKQILPTRFNLGNEKYASFSMQYGVVIGNARNKVDLMITPNGSKLPPYSIGLVDLSSFSTFQKDPKALLDYYFQLQRAQPKVLPIFLYLHELADERSVAFQRIISSLEKLQVKVKNQEKRKLKKAQ